MKTEDGHETPNNRLKELTEEELKSVLGGSGGSNKQLLCPACREPIGVTMEMIIKSKSLVCPKCGLRLNID